MSHFTTLESVIQYKDTATLDAALKLIAKEKQGLEIIHESENKIIIRYKPIETYQRNGNLHFMKENGVWKVVGDAYMCRDEFNALVNRVATAYQEAGLRKILLQQQYTARVTANANGKVTLEAVKY